MIDYKKYKREDFVILVYECGHYGAIPSRSSALFDLKYNPNNNYIIYLETDNNSSKCYGCTLKNFESKGVITK